MWARPANCTKSIGNSSRPETDCGRVDEDCIGGAFSGRLCYGLWLFHLHSAVKIQPFSPVFLLAEYRAKAFFRLSLWNFKEKSINHFLEHSLLERGLSLQFPLSSKGVCRCCPHAGGGLDEGLFFVGESMFGKRKAYPALGRERGWGRDGMGRSAGWRLPLC